MIGTATLFYFDAIPRLPIGIRHGYCNSMTPGMRPLSEVDKSR